MVKMISVRFFSGRAMEKVIKSVGSEKPRVTFRVAENTEPISFMGALSDKKVSTFVSEPVVIPREDFLAALKAGGAYLTSDPNERPVAFDSQIEGLILLDCINDKNCLNKRTTSAEDAPVLVATLRSYIASNPRQISDKTALTIILCPHDLGSKELVEAFSKLWLAEETSINFLNWYYQSEN